MTTTRRRAPWALLVIGSGVCSGIHLGLLHLFLWRSWLAPVVFLTGSVAFSLVSWFLMRVVFPRVGGRTFGALLAKQLAIAVALFLPASVLFTDAVARWLGAPGVFGAAVGDAQTIVITAAHRQAMVRLYALLPLPAVIGMTLLGYHVVIRQVRRMLARERELTDLAATAQLAALRAQINPHFLFNSLNSIAQLIRTDPDKAEACVERLAQIFRYILNRAEQEFVPLSEELEMTEAYLDIERARFAERLAVSTRIDPASLRQPIPNLVLQPLVENAIKHGLSRKMGRGTLSIGAEMHDGTLTLTVSDDGLGMPGTVLDDVWHRGVGLRNLRARLERLYGAAHLPEIVSRPGVGTTVRLTFPTAPAEAA
jgi:LytS/YehU family sensor histidine kinase